MISSGLGGGLPSSASGWNGNGGHSRGGPSNNGRHHSLPHQFGNSPASMMLNSYCTMTNSKFARPFFLISTKFGGIVLINQHMPLFFYSIEGEREKAMVYCIDIFAVYIPEVLSTNTPRNPNNQFFRGETRREHKNIQKIKEETRLK